MLSTDAFDPFVQVTQSPLARFKLDRPPTASDLRILSVVGEGGYGDVFEAVHVVSGMKVAVKTYKCDKSNNAGIPTDGIREISVLLELRHPNILGLLAVLNAPESPERPLFYSDDIPMPRSGLWLISELCTTDLTRVSRGHSTHSTSRRFAESRSWPITVLATTGLKSEEGARPGSDSVLTRYAHSRFKSYSRCGTATTETSFTEISSRRTF